MYAKHNFIQIFFYKHLHKEGKIATTLSLAKVFSRHFDKLVIRVRVLLQLNLGVESNWNSFDSIWKFAICLIRKGKKYSKNSMKINSKFVWFDSTPTIGWSQIFQMLDSFEICSIRFENLWFHWFQKWKIIRKIW